MLSLQCLKIWSANFDGADYSSCSSISIACWVVVFSPQIIENFRRKSADALSLLFLVIWLAGDVFNILGAVLQGVLPTMIILAVYYTLADIVLLFQCFYYRGFPWSDESQKQQGEERPPSPEGYVDDAEHQESSDVQESSEQTPLLSRETQNGRYHRSPTHPSTPSRRRSSLTSLSTLREQFARLDSTHLSPAMPLIEPPKPSAKNLLRPASSLQIALFNTFTVVFVCAAGVLGWYISVRSTPRRRQGPGQEPEALTFDILGQIFGYLCAVLYLGSRIPQLLLNWRRRSTEGVSFLFFLFACIGNLTYVLSIFAYSPVCRGDGGACQPAEQGEIYGRYILVNLSWLLGSLGTLFLDVAIFAQFIIYRQNNGVVDDGTTERGDYQEET